MSTYKHIDRICAVILACAAVLTLLFVNGEALGVQPAAGAMGYEDRIFDTARVHTIDIVMDDWEGFISACENEEYAACAVVIDGETCRNVGIRAKGNTSLTAVSSLGSERYSFKLEFDQYDGASSFHGLDKLCLNNVIQDTTYMKDYLAYRLMASFGVDAPLCSYAYLTVNGEDWGLYLAVEGVEDSFLQRVYGRDYGNLYKPDSMSFGGGRGNGQRFDMAGFMDLPDGAAGPESGTRPDMPPESGAPGDGGADGAFSPGGPMGGGMSGGMGSSDVKLQYIDDDPDSYPNIFSSAKTSVSEAGQARLIRALKALSEQTDLESAVNVEEVIRYFVVHNFVCNGDSYTGAMVHNYYLYEEDGRLSMIPWDYNLAFGTFQANDASGAVNSPIDTPVSGGSTDDRPMVDWIFSGEMYTQLYHQYFAEFLESTDFSALTGETAGLIAPYVEKDPTKFCTYEEFQAGVEALRTFCQLRAESVAGQLDGTIPSTAAGQSAEPSSLIDASGLTLSDMGSMDSGIGGMGGGAPGGAAPVPAGMNPGVPDGAAPAPAGTDSGGALLLAASLAILLAGIAIALKFRR